MLTMIKSLFVTVLSGLLAVSAFAQIEIEQLEPEEYFDFWVGEWEVSWDEGDNIIGSGTNIVEKTLDGKVIQENFRITEGQNKGFKGTSLSLYQPRFERWKQAWADNKGGYYDFLGKTDGNKRIFQTGVIELDDGQEFTQRMIFYDITEDSMTWDWEASFDGGDTWSLNWRIFYKRLKR